MWNGHFSPRINLRKSVDGATFTAADGRTEDDLTSPDDDEVPGTMTVILSGDDYEFPNVTFGVYALFEQSGFSGSWMNANLPITPPGGWGWPFGRDHSRVHFNPKTGEWWTDKS